MSNIEYYDIQYAAGRTINFNLFAYTYLCLKMKSTLYIPSSINGKTFSWKLVNNQHGWYKNETLLFDIRY